MSDESSEPFYGRTEKDEFISARETFKFSDNQRPADFNPNFGSPNAVFNTGEYLKSDQNYVINRPPVQQQLQQHRPQRPPPPSQPHQGYAQYYDYQSQRPYVHNQPQQHRPQASHQYSPYPQNYYQGNPSQYRPPQNYAGNYNTYQPESGGGGGDNPLMSFINNLGQGASDLIYGQRPTGLVNGPNNGPNGAPNPLGQFGKAIEEITRHDDLQCIPKIICQMVGGQRRQSSLTPLLGSPVFSS